MGVDGRCVGQLATASWRFDYTGERISDKTLDFSGSGLMSRCFIHNEFPPRSGCLTDWAAAVKLGLKVNGIEKDAAKRVKM